MSSLVIFTLISVIISLVSAQGINQKCNEDSDCQYNEDCFKPDNSLEGSCRCADDFKIFIDPSRFECGSAKKLDETCASNLQCRIIAGTFSLCNNYKICVCAEEAHAAKDGNCYRTARLNEPCLHNENCKLADGLSGVCRYERCDCDIGFRPSPDKIHCVKSLDLGDRCSNETDCELILNARCGPSGRCDCKPDYAITRDGRACLEVADNFGDPCIEDLQCSRKLYNSTCLDQMCSCNNGFHKYGKECVRSARILENCDENANCVLDPKLENIVECIEGKCRCINGETEDEQTCKSSSVGNLMKSTVFSRTISIVTLTIIFYVQ